MRLKTIALAACISGFVFASCNNKGDDKDAKKDSTVVKTDTTMVKPMDTSSMKKDTMKMDTSMKTKGKPIVNP